MRILALPFIPSQTMLRVDDWLFQAMEQYGTFLLRAALGVVFIWFGGLKVLGMSPALELVLKTTFWIPLPDFPTLLGCWEVLIGMCFIWRPALRWALVMLTFHMPGTMLPLVMLPQECFLVFPYALTMEGQYIIKNVVLISAALVIGGKLKLIEQEEENLAPTHVLRLLADSRRQTVAAGSTLLFRQGEGVFLVCEGLVEVRRPGREPLQLTSGEYLPTGSGSRDSQVVIQVLRTTTYIQWEPGNVRADEASTAA
ncbi:hypothetical protein [Acanthopleuribacter pedis]|uniref:Uncharacterized protein n=1 Tax=Acanthopleuribacter pedis TaxID=442870 RepID=A0A8J7U2C9_9BACT|nr:hypothetical protein [Acanthopleuribacter pedis]MBO1318467.1 hypothetical protein [Acanthopleuribacter pedis]